MAKPVNPTPLKIDFHFGLKVPRNTRALLKRAILVSLQTIPKSVLKKKLRPRTPYLLHVSVLTAPQMKRLNASYRGKNRPTDVLSFSRLEGPPPPVADIGDLLLCWKVAKEQAKRFGVTLPEELVRLTAHGMLHLFGYDHETSAKDARVMFALQDKIIKKVSGF